MQLGHAIGSFSSTQGVIERHLAEGRERSKPNREELPAERRPTLVAPLKKRAKRTLFFLTYGRYGVATYGKKGVIDSPRLETHAQPVDLLARVEL